MVRRIALARETVDLKQRDLDRKNTLVANRAGSQADLDNSMTLLVVAKTALEQLEQQTEAIRNQLLGDPESADREVSALRAGRRRARSGQARPRSHRAARTDRRHGHSSREHPARPLSHRRHARVQPDRRHEALDRCEPEGNRHHAPQGRPAGRHLGRYLPGPQIPRRGRGGQPRHGRAVRDPAAAERERKLGQGGAARPGAHRIRAGRGCARPALRHERERRHRHRPAEHRLSRRSASAAGLRNRANDRRGCRAVARRAPRAADDLHHDGDDHAGARHHDRQRRAALHAGLALGLARSGELGAHLLHRRSGDDDRAGRLAGGSLRPQEAVHRLRRRLHGRVAVLRVRAEHRSRSSRSV